jgi:type I restriction enzyme S subunit
MFVGGATIRSIAALEKYSVAGGPFGSELTRRDYVESGVPVIRGANLPTDKRFSFEDFVYVSPTKANELKGNQARPGDIVVTQRGTLGQVGLIPADSPFPQFVISQSQMKLTVDPEKADTRYVYYYLRSPQAVARIRNMAITAGVPHINLGLFQNMLIQLPPLGIQERTASILSAYDDLIENNTRRIQILEEMAQAIYREWFVEFRFPGHEGVRMVDSELGPIPEGWQAIPLGRLLEKYIGGGWGSECEDDTHGCGARVIRGTDMPRARVLDLSSAPVRFHEASNLAKRLLAENDIVIEVSGGSSDQPVGRVLFVSSELLDVSGGPTMCASFCKLLRVASGHSPLLVYWHLRDLYDSRGIEEYQVQSTGIKNLRFSQLAHADLCVVPGQRAQSEFDGVVRPMMSLQASLGRANANLRETRDFLLPRLISGEIDVSELDIGDAEPAA